MGRWAKRNDYESVNNVVQSSMACRRIVLIGFGCVAQGLLPLLRANFPQVPCVLIEAHWDRQRSCVADEFNALPINARVSADNLAQILSPWLARGVFVLNLATNVASRDVLLLCRAAGAWYVDTSIEPWSYASSSEDAAAPLCTNYALREAILKERVDTRLTPTAVIAHGANPGFVSALVKMALLEMAKRADSAQCHIERPQTSGQWARLARALDVAVIHISEVDSQESLDPVNPSEFANTWSTEGFLSECLQQAELAWGSHEKNIPQGACVQGARAASLVLASRGMDTRIQSWSPSMGGFQAFLLSHNEAFSIADFLSVEDDAGFYRPSVYYAYRPCPAARASIAWLKKHGAATRQPHRLLKESLQHGQDELGVLLFSTRHGALWYGSQLELHAARRIAYNSATSLQVAASIVAAMHWILLHPEAGLCESEAIDERFLFDHTAPFWEPIRFFSTRWLPTQKADWQFAQFLRSPHYTL